MARFAVLIACALLLILAGTVYATTGLFTPPLSGNSHSTRDAACHFRNADPHHWRACLLRQ